MERIIVDKASKKFKIGFEKKQSALARFISMSSGRESKRTFLALKDISFSANSGDFIGIIGENASGKSTLLSVIAGIYAQEKGTVKTNGEISSSINLPIGLKEKLTMKDNIYLFCSFFNLDQKIIKERFNSIVEFAELKGFINTKIYQFSTGMKIRLSFSIAAHCNPKILLIDDYLDLIDENFKNKFVKKIEELLREGVTVLLVSHNLNLIKKHCHKVIWLHKGRILMEGKPKEVIGKYLKESSKKEE